MDMKSWRQGILTSPRRIAIPIMTHPGIDRIGCRVVDAVTDGEVHFRAIRALTEAFPSAACCTIMDLTLEAEAFGADVVFPENDIPAVEGRLVQDAQAIEELTIPSLDEARLPQMLKACTMAAEQIKDRPVLGGVIGPYSLACRLYGMTELMIGCFCEPEAIGMLLQKCTDFLIAYCKRLKQTGIQGLMMAEPAAGLVSEEDCMNFSSVYIRQIVEAVQDDEFLFVLHNCGTNGHCAEAMVATGAQGLHFGNKADMLKVLEACPSDILVMGNLDPVGIFLQSTPEEVYAKTTELLNQTSRFPNYVLSSGCDVPPHVPQDNIEAFYNALNNYNSER